MTKLRAVQRRAQILAEAVAMAADGGLYSMTLDDVAGASDVARATVIHYFRSMQGVRDAVVRYAIRFENLDILAQAIIGHDPIMHEMGSTLRRRAIDAVV